MSDDDRDFIERTRSLTGKLYGNPASIDQIADQFALYGVKNRASTLEDIDAELRGKHSQNHQAVTGMGNEDIKTVVAETLVEQQRRHWDDIDAIVVKAIATTLTSFGIEEEDRQELRADLQHLRRWRNSVEQAHSYTFKAVITVIVTGLVGAVWLGVKVMLGK